MKEFDEWWDNQPSKTLARLFTPQQLLLVKRMCFNAWLSSAANELRRIIDSKATTSQSKG